MNATVLLCLAGVVKPTTASACEDRSSGSSPTVGDWSSTHSMGPFMYTSAQTTDITGAGGVAVRLATGAGFNATDPLVFADGGITGKFHYDITLTDCTTGYVFVTLEIYDGNGVKYTIGTGGTVTGPHANGEVNIAGTSTGMKSTLDNDGKLKDLMVRAYFKCENPAVPAVKIWEHRVQG